MISLIERLSKCENITAATIEVGSDRISGKVCESLDRFLASVNEKNEK